MTWNGHHSPAASDGDCNETGARTKHQLCHCSHLFPPTMCSPKNKWGGGSIIFLKHLSIENIHCQLKPSYYYKSFGKQQNIPVYFWTSFFYERSVFVELWGGNQARFRCLADPCIGYVRLCETGLNSGLLLGSSVFSLCELSKCWWPLMNSPGIKVCPPPFRVDYY